MGGECPIIQLQMSAHPKWANYDTGAIIRPGSSAHFHDHLQFEQLWSLYDKSVTEYGKSLSLKSLKTLYSWVCMHDKSSNEYGGKGALISMAS